MKTFVLVVALSLASVLCRAEDPPQTSETSCAMAKLGFKASMAGFHIDRCISTVDGKLSLLAIDLKRVMTNGSLYPGYPVRHIEFASMKAYAEMTCSVSEKKDIDRLWKESECKWAKSQQ